MTAEGERQMLALLTDIRDLLAGPIAGSSVPEPEPACEHPEEARVNLLAMGDHDLVEFFRCRKCKRTIRR
ncbi:MAG TPA: hypothetical protein VEU08_02390 [Vicinamibacterales bacterium]|nr:hypothetical protein [Vicinamibacterales bacterium]